MNIRLFNRLYWVRRFGEQKLVKGYLTSGYNDFVASLHVHPMGEDSMKALPEGLRKEFFLEGHGEHDLVTADEARNQKGDLLYYYGEWYECISSKPWRTTMLSHWNYKFVRISPNGYNTNDPKPPNGEPSKGGVSR